MIKPIRNEKITPFYNIFINKKEMYNLSILFIQLVIVTNIIYIIFFFNYIFSFANKYNTTNSDLIY